MSETTCSTEGAVCLWVLFNDALNTFYLRLYGLFVCMYVCMY